MAATYTILRYTFPDRSGSMEKTVRAPEFGNRDVFNPQQTVHRSLGGQIYVFNRGPRLRSQVFTFEMLDPIERADLEEFFAALVVDQVCKWFALKLTPNQREVIVCGGKVETATVKCGTYKCGQRILMDSITYNARLLTPELEFEEARDGRWNLSLTVEILLGFLPSNLCL